MEATNATFRLCFDPIFIVDTAAKPLLWKDATHPVSPASAQSFARETWF